MPAGGLSAGAGRGKGGALEVGPFCCALNARRRAGAMWRRKKMIEIRRCPFCGGEAKLMGGKVYTIPVIDRNGAYVDADIEVEPSWVECQSCHAMGQTFDETDEDPENAVAAWNRRV